MSDSITTLPRVNLSFGGCPICHKTDGFLSVGPGHWFVCHRHRVKWHIGSNLFSSWKELGEQRWQANRYRLAGYRDVEPWVPDDVRERLELQFRANHSKEDGDEVDCPF